MAKLWFSPLAAACVVPVVSCRCERGGSANIGTKRITSGRGLGQKGMRFCVRATCVVNNDLNGTAESSALID